MESIKRGANTVLGESYGAAGGVPAASQCPEPLRHQESTKHSELALRIHPNGSRFATGDLAALADDTQQDDGLTERVQHHYGKQPRSSQLKAKRPDSGATSKL